MAANLEKKMPGLNSLTESLVIDLNLRAACLMHVSGQLLTKDGKLPEADYPQMGALMAGMISAGTSLSALFSAADVENNSDDYGLHYGDSKRGFYAIAINSEHWLTVLYEDVLNPGKLRMRCRIFAEQFARLMGTEMSEAGAKSTVISDKTAPKTGENQALFTNISDKEIDQLFQI